MKTDIIINVTSHETRVGILEEDKLVELFVERPFNQRILGNIYKGVVKKVLPSLQAAFVDIGQDKNAFLHVSDMVGFSSGEDDENENSVVVEYSRKKIYPPIEDLLKNEHEIMVQVVKEPIGTKGPRVTTNINVPGRFLVLLMKSRKIAISRKIVDKAERSRLRRIVDEHKPHEFGFIIRTVSLDKDADLLQKDIIELTKICKQIQVDFQKKKATVLLYKEISLMSSVIRDLFSDDVTSVIVDGKKEYDEIVSYLKHIKSELHERVYFYRNERPIFDNYRIEEEITTMLDREVWMKRGGYLVIEHTEALVSIDVNSGSCTKGSNSESFILSINLEAAKEIARQLQLRDIGGLIIIDFIDMQIRQNRDKVFNELRQAMRRDRAKYFILNFSEFGLIEVTRQRVKPSFLFTYSITCPTCSGLGRIDSPLTTVSKIEHWFQRARMWLEDSKFIVKVNPIVAEFIKSEDLETFKEIQKRNRIQMILEIDNHLQACEYKILIYRTGQDITAQFLQTHAQ